MEHFFIAQPNTLLLFANTAASIFFSSIANTVVLMLMFFSWLFPAGCRQADESG